MSESPDETRSGLPLFDGTADTGVGSYFVSNYPPFSAWSTSAVADARAAIDLPAAKRVDPGLQAAKLGLYMHIPFCRKRCKFCYFRVYTDKNSSDVETYLDALSREVALYADRGVATDREFEFVYFGGGTPSFLSEKQLESLISRISRHWSWDSAREVTFECEPGTLKKSKLEAIRRIGTTRLSLGIEHFDDSVLEINGRAHRSGEVFRAYEWAREVGFPQVNVDLIAGMLGDSDDLWRDAVAKVIALDPDSITIYQMELPANTVFARSAREADGGSGIASWATKRRWVDYAFEQLTAVGYEVSSAYTLIRPERHAGFVYRDAVWQGADMVGTGVASFSHVGGVHYQNLDQWEDYVGALSSGQFPLSRAMTMTPLQRMIREWVLQLKLGSVSFDYFRDKFGLDPAVQFDAVLSTLREQGLASIDDKGVVLARAGLLRVDELLHRFFEPQFHNPVAA
ncbi:MAG: coproporphyrinogen-III oxidase family protein [Planctomycetota bacterium]|jgi:oxygen-independent coproporphyrinogen-3 oxidase